MKSLVIPDNIVYASFFFIDIVGLSNPKMSTNTQSTKIADLNKIISDCNTFKNFPKEHLIVLPTGDGMAIGFQNGLEKPIELAIEIQKKLQQYNKDKDPIYKIQVRIGNHYGNVFKVDDIFKNQNFWGPGLILARRVMDIGDGGHILLTSSMGEILFELSDRYKKIIHPIHDYKIKHDQIMLVYSVYGDGFGNSSRPTNNLFEKESFNSFNKIQKAVTCQSVEFSLSLKNIQSNLIEHSRKYDLINNSDEPIFEIINGIITSVEKPLQDLNLKILDEHGEELSLSRINLDASYRKEFVIKLDPPVVMGEKGRNYSLTYKVEEPRRIYENLFLINSPKLIFNFSYDELESGIDPKLFVIENTTREKFLLQHYSKKTHNGIVNVKWEIENGIMEKDMVRIEW